MKLYKYLLGFASFVFLIYLIVVDNALATSIALQDDSVVRLPEGNDFATQVLGNPWDMREFSDISKALNNSGRNDLVQNFQVTNGIFSADSTDFNYAQFYTLFPGYLFGMSIGNIGDRFPISSQDYRCLYLRMKVETSGNDSWYVTWLPTKSQTIVPGSGGQLWGGTQLHDDDLPAGSWRIYSVDLADPPNDPGYPFEAWTDRSYWKGFRIHPTNTPNAHFEVDWVRLTDCTPVNYEVTWNPEAGQSQLWAGIGGQQKDILITTLDASQANYTWDVQGLEPGHYEIGVEANGQMTWLSTSIDIEPAPIAEFTKPSPYSGEDFATSLDNPWDFSGSDDLVYVSCTDWYVSNGIFDLITLAPANLPDVCTGSIGEADGHFRLNLHGSNPRGSEYRYLSFRHKIDGDLERSADGMIGRWIWRYGTCTQVSDDIPYDVGWHTYVIDLYDPSLGFATQAVGCDRNYWANSGPIERLRFDQNENWTGNEVPAMSFHQQFDWIRLTKVDQASQGAPFPIQISLNKSPDTIQNIEFYYTDNLDDPTRYKAAEYASQIAAQSSMAASQKDVSNSEISLTLDYQVFLPIVANRHVPLVPPPSVENEVLFWWNTSAVSPAEYYTCAVMDDGLNQAIYCSEAPIKIVP